MSTYFQWQSLLPRVSGNQELGRRLLAAFLAEHPSPAAALAGRDADGARLLLHRMAGSAGNLGLTPLAQACRRGEEMVAGGTFPAAETWRLTLAAIEDCLRFTRAEVEDFLARPAEPAAPAAPAADERLAADLATQLAALLDRNDLAALTVADAWAQAAGAEVSAALLNSVRALDFAAAARLLEDWNRRHD